MKKILVPIFSFMFLTSTSCVNATTHFNDKDKEKDHYSWRPTDESQERIAVGMITWGITIAIAGLVISAFLPNDGTNDPTSLTPGAGTSGSGSGSGDSGSGDSGSGGSSS